MFLTLPSGMNRSISVLMPYNASMKATAINGLTNTAINQLIAQF